MKKNNIKKKTIQLVLTYNRTLPNISEVARKKWHILQTTSEFRNMFIKKLTIALKRNKDIEDLICVHLIKDGKVAKNKLERKAR